MSVELNCPAFYFRNIPGQEAVDVALANLVAGAWNEASIRARESSPTHPAGLKLVAYQKRVDGNVSSRRRHIFIREGSRSENSASFRCA